MGEQEISKEAGGQLLDRLMKESTLVLAVFVSETGAITSLYGFINSITAEGGILVSSSVETTPTSSTISASIGNPVGAGCKFAIEKAPDDKLELRYGTTTLVVRRLGMIKERVVIIFNAKSAVD